MSRTLSRSRHGVAAVFSVALAACVAMPAFAESPAAPASSSDNGSVWWSELVSAHPEKARDFYASVIGWTPKIVSADDNSRPPAPGESEYTLFNANGSEQAGLTKYEGKPNDPRPGWVTYIQVGNVDAAVSEAIKKGGRVLKAPSDVDDVGRLAIIEDPDGNPVGLYAPEPKQAADADNANH
ncbi:VOC family protein [Hyphomicrobium sp. DY-1]|uniref:VOC family protein n=1 Tax=Hyphomicrobium sp. DY-1 TaxID=3075650 RepID=UPI0039C3EB3D